MCTKYSTAETQMRHLRPFSNIVQDKHWQHDTKKATKANEKAFQNVKVNSKLVVMTDDWLLPG